MRVVRRDGRQELIHHVTGGRSIKDERCMCRTSIRKDELWIGFQHRLTREEIEQFMGHLQSWLDTGDFVRLVESE